MVIIQGHHRDRWVGAGVPGGYHGGTAKYRLPLVQHQQRLICLAKLDINIVIVPKSLFLLFPTKLEGIKKLLLEGRGGGTVGWGLHGR